MFKKVYNQNSTLIPSSARSSCSFSNFLYSVLYFKQSTLSGAFVHRRIPASSTLAHLLFYKSPKPHF